MGAAASTALADSNLQRALTLQLAAGGTVVGYVVESASGRRLSIARNESARYVAPRGQRRPPSEPTVLAGLWRFTEHVCRDCIGRLVERMDGPESGTFRCTICGVQHAGAIEDICGCGIRRRGQDMGFRCRRNARRTAEFPHEIIVERVPLDQTPPGQSALTLRDPQ